MLSPNENLDPNDNNKYFNQPIKYNGKYKFEMIDSYVVNENDPNQPIGLLGYTPSYLEDQTSDNYDINIDVKIYIDTFIVGNITALNQSTIHEYYNNSLKQNRWTYFYNQNNGISFLTGIEIIMIRDYNEDFYEIRYYSDFSSSTTATIYAKSWVYTGSLASNSPLEIYNGNEKIMSLYDSADTKVSSILINKSKFKFNISWLIFPTN